MKMCSDEKNEVEKISKDDVSITFHQDLCCVTPARGPVDEIYVEEKIR
jgi:hypothetical protein